MAHSITRLMTVVPLQKTPKADKDAKDGKFFFQVKTQLNFEVILIISNNVSSKIKEFFYYLAIGLGLKNLKSPLCISNVKNAIFTIIPKNYSDAIWPSYSCIYNHTLSMDLEQPL